MIAIKPLARTLELVGVISVGFGYLKAYVGPFFVISLNRAGYGYEQIALIQSSLFVFSTVGAWASIVAVAVLSYHDGGEYELTMSSGAVLIILVYLAELFGSFVGATICQIQIPEYPILQFSLLQIVTSYGYVYVVLIGVLAANYVRERGRHNAHETKKQGPDAPLSQQQM